jgi:hypothetical protein
MRLVGLIHLKEQFTFSCTAVSLLFYAVLAMPEAVLLSCEEL